MQCNEKQNYLERPRLFTLKFQSQYASQNGFRTSFRGWRFSRATAI